MDRVEDILKSAARWVCVLVIYGVVTFGFCALVQAGAAESFPSIISSPEQWQLWCLQSTLITAGISLVVFIVYQILTSAKLLGATTLKDPNQKNIRSFNFVMTIVHFVLTAYIGFGKFGYFECIQELLSWGFDRFYFFFVPLLGYTLLFWLLTRTLSNSCIYRYNRWKLIR